MKEGNNMRHSTKKAMTALAMYLRLRIPVWAVIVGLVLILSQAAMAQCASILEDGDFEEQRTDRLMRPWFPEGRAAIDPKERHLSYRYDNNGWAGKKAGWNGIFHSPTVLRAGVLYTLTAYVRTSDDVRGDLFLGFRNKDQTPVYSQKFGPLPGYKELTVKLRPDHTGEYRVFIGFWSRNPESWFRVDSVGLWSACHDTR
jgi:hypothetical protein